MLVKLRLTCKLNSLYHGTLLLKETKDKFLNLSNFVLNANEKYVLNLGLNSHLQRKIDPLEKKTEIELLYQRLIEMSEKGTVVINNALADSLRHESNKIRFNHNTVLLTATQREACKALRSDEDIVIRKADKSSIYVNLNREDYKNKLYDILKDQSKFARIHEDPIKNLKKTLNDIIKTNNAVSNYIKLPVFAGDYIPGYIYGNCKIH